MELDTSPAVVGGTCDVCRGPYEAGDFVSQPFGDEVMCPACVLDHLTLEAS